MRLTITILLGLAVILFFIGQNLLFAHHSFAAEFDAAKPVTLTGTVTKVEWTNPHTWFYLDVKDETTGEVRSWGLEMGSPNALSNLGWTRNTLKVGDRVTVNGYLAKSGKPRANARSVKVSDGRDLLAASSAGESK
jgi:hypothetical protein